MSEIKCPLCKQAVPQELYEKITGIWKERRIQEKAFKEEKRKLLTLQREAKRELLAEKKRLKTEQKAAVQNQVALQTKSFTNRIVRLERQKNKIAEQADRKILAAVKSAERKARLEINKQMKDRHNESVKKQVEKATTKAQKESLRITRTLESTKKQMSTLKIQNQTQQDKIRNLEIQLKNKTTPQLEGLLYENKLLEALKKDFPKDKFQHTGKGGDIVQEIFLDDDNSAGVMVYECKRVAQWQTAHLEQCANAKLQRKADFAILVTNAQKRGTSGFFIERNVIVINPGGVLAIASILRDQIIQMAQLRLTKVQKEETIENTLKYLQGAEFKNALEVVIRKTKEMYDDLKKEYKEHFRAWEKRHDALKTIYMNAADVQTKTAALVSGKKDVAQIGVEPFPALPNLIGEKVPGTAEGATHPEPPA